MQLPPNNFKINTIALILDKIKELSSNGIIFVLMDERFYSLLQLNKDSNILDSNFRFILPDINEYDTLNSEYKSLFIGNYFLASTFSTVSYTQNFVFVKYLQDTFGSSKRLYKEESLIEYESFLYFKNITNNFKIKLSPESIKETYNKVFDFPEGRVTFHSTNYFSKYPSLARILPDGEIEILYRYSVEFYPIFIITEVI